MEDKRFTFRVLSALLRYPDADFRAAVPEMIQALDVERALPAARLAELTALLGEFLTMDPFEAEARFLEIFDRGRATSLHLFEHVHGDSRDRGPALVDLGETYERAGLSFQGDELPDHLSVVLEFVSTQPEDVATGFLGEIEHILNAVFSALRERQSPYACVIAAVLEMTGQKAKAVAVEADQALDESWAEPVAFDGCSTAGQATPGTPQPIHIVRSKKPDTPSQGARA